MTFDSRTIAYLITLLGLAIAFLAAFVPFFTASYHLEAAVMVVLAIPFVIYLALSSSLSGPWLLGTGLILLAISAVVMITQRFEHQGMNIYDPSYWLPLFASVILLPSAYLFGKLKETGTGT
jgi:inner membrane protein involved in colicin E2 resistance